MSGDTSSSDLKLPPGFRFHPSDEEIITFYLKPKSIDDGFIAHAIGEADINRSEPWELPAMAKMGEKEWYFYCLKGRKYPSGFRANRATKAGYWKATGKDREIYRATSRSRRPVLVGMKKTLVFYKGRAPTGAKTDWVMHEFRLEGSGRPSSPTVGSSSSNTTAMKSSSKEEWVVCRIYHKSSGVKKSPASPFDITTVTGDVDPRSTNFSLPMPNPMGSEGFTIDSNTPHPIMDPSMSFYSATGISSTVCPSLSPMVGMSNSELQMENNNFRNSVAMARPSPFYQHTGMGPMHDGGFMAGLDNRSVSIVSQDPRMSPHHTNVVDISSMMSASLASIATTNTGDGAWKF
ncbi:hypothetical protein QOZ80_2AG0138240 [Eleusine coracana subsp. coracana]|nr:hypothetical protein QOZ80_2AG0138240 [Eleusine coracana subsp. coracana]